MKNWTIKRLLWLKQPLTFKPVTTDTIGVPWCTRALLSLYIPCSNILFYLIRSMIVSKKRNQGPSVSIKSSMSSIEKKIRMLFFHVRYQLMFVFANSVWRTYTIYRTNPINNCNILQCDIRVWFLYGKDGKGQWA